MPKKKMATKKVPAGKHMMPGMPGMMKDSMMPGMMTVKGKKKAKYK
jgi:hypothetical protein